MSRQPLDSFGNNMYVVLKVNSSTQEAKKENLEFQASLGTKQRTCFNIIVKIGLFPYQDPVSKNKNKNKNKHQNNKTFSSDNCKRMSIVDSVVGKK
jgi:hypothetical protein